MNSDDDPFEAFEGEELPADEDLEEIEDDDNDDDNADNENENEQVATNPRAAPAPQSAAARLQRLLLDACYRGDVAAVQSLHSSHAPSLDLNVVDRRDATPLMLATQGNHVELVEFLLSHGAQVNFATPLRHFTALRHAVACRADPVDSQHVLLDRGANLEQVDVDGATPLLFTCRAAKWRAARMLVLRGADVDAACHGATPLSLAVANNCPDMVRFLLCHGARVATDVNRAIAMLAVTKSPDSLPMLLAAGARVNVYIPYMQHVTPLIVATERRAVDSVALLVAAGANVHMRDSNYRTAIDVTPAVAEIRHVLAAVGAVGLRQYRGRELAAAHWRISGAKRIINGARVGFIRDRAVEVCIGLQSLRLPALMALMIVDEACVGAQLVPLHSRWSLVTAVKHFHERQAAIEEQRRQLAYVLQWYSNFEQRQQRQ